MLTIHWYSVLLAVAALTSAAMGIAAVTLPHVRSRATKSFLMLNVGVVCWTLAYLIQLESSPNFDPVLAPIGSGLWWLSALKVVGLATTPVGWFMFAAAQTRRMNLTRGAWLWGSIVFYAYAVVVHLTNPLHHLYQRAEAVGSDVVYGPLMWPYLLGSWLLLVGGTWVLVTGLWRLGTPEDRRRSVIMGVAIGLPLAGGIFYNLRHVFGVALPLNPAPIGFGITTVVVAIDVFRAGLADIVPISAAQAFQAMSDIAIVADGHLKVVAVNAAAESAFPELKFGVDLADGLPDAARHARECLRTACDFLPFELAVGKCVYWGRVYPTKSRTGRAVGCVVMLSDITDLRYAQQQLALAVERHEEGRSGQSSS